MQSIAVESRTSHGLGGDVRQQLPSHLRMSDAEGSLVPVSTLPQSQRGDGRDGGRCPFLTTTPTERRRVDPFAQDSSSEGTQAFTGATPEALV